MPSPQKTPRYLPFCRCVFPAFWVLIVLFLSSGVSATPSQEVHIGLLAKRGLEIDLQTWTPTADYLSAHVPGYHFRMVPLDFNRIHEAVRNNRIAFVLANSAFYVELEKLHGVNRIATLINRNPFFGQTTTFGGVIFCRADRTDMQRLDDLQDRRFMAVEPRSFGGWIACWRELHRRGIDPLRFFASLEYGQTHDAVVVRVLDGTVDAGTVRTDTLERMAETGRIRLDDVRVLNEQSAPGFPFRLSTALYPEWPMAALKTTPAPLVRQVASALLAMAEDDPAARAGKNAGWTAPLNYQSVHDCLLDLRIGPYADFGQFTLIDVFRRYWGTLSLLLAAVIAILLISAYILRLNRRLRRKKNEVDELNATLEARVVERTHQINTLLDREMYLRAIMETVTKINGLLISATDLHTLMNGACGVMGKHSHYGYCWIGLLENGLINQVVVSDPSIRLPGPLPYDPSDATAPFTLSSAARCLATNATVVLVGGEGKSTVTPWLDLTNPPQFRAVIALLLRPDRYTPPLGVLCVYTMRSSGFEPEEIAMLEELAGDIGFAVHSFRQRDQLARMERERRANYEQTIRSFADMIDQRDTYTAGHSIRVAHYSRQLAKEMGLSAAQLDLLEQAAILHDIGKIATPDSVLLKPGTLSPLDYELIKLHATAGHGMLAGIPMYNELATIIRHHHERYDGTGYPDRLQGKAIPFLSRIITVADSFDAMTTNRIYKPRKTVEEALDELKRFSGSQFDPDVVVVGVRVLKDVTIPKSIDQLPKNQMEQRRFSYFFSDKLTGFFNEDYLRIMLRSGQAAHQYRCLHGLHVNNLEQYNKRHGWEQGNVLMQHFAAELRAHYPNALLFRIYGRNFAIMTIDHFDLDEAALSFACLRETGVTVESSHIDLLDNATHCIDKLDKLELLCTVDGCRV